MVWHPALAFPHRSGFIYQFNETANKFELIQTFNLVVPRKFKFTTIGG